MGSFKVLERLPSDIASAIVSKTLLGNPSEESLDGSSDFNQGSKDCVAI